jgi:stage II sporulation protein D
VISGEDFRLAIGTSLGWNLVRSDLFNLRDSPDEIILNGAGSGHGAGMCQTEAEHMGDAGRDYREILAFYYPGASLGKFARGLDWITLGGERIKLETVNPDRDRPLVRKTDVFANQAEHRAGLAFRSMPVLRIYPDVATFRDATGEPGWVAGRTRASVISIRPTSYCVTNYCMN